MRILVRWALTAVVAAGLVIDAYVHWDVAHNYVGLPSPSFITEYGLFKFEAVLAVVTLLLVLVRPNRITWGIAAAVLLGGAAALYVYYEWHVGRIGPLPDMSDHTWYPRPQKALSAIAELIGGLAAVGLVLLPRAASTQPSGTHALT